MKRKQSLYPLIILLVLLAGCQPNPSAIPGSHRAASVNTPPPPPPSVSAQPGQSAVPYDPDHPLGRWQSDGYFRDAQIIIPDAEKFPILIAETATLHWEKMKSFAFDDVPEGTEFTECDGRLDFPPTETSHTILTSGYETKYGEETRYLGKTIWSNQHSYSKFFEQERYHRYNCVDREFDERPENVLEPARSIPGIRYSPEEAARMVEDLLRDGGVDTSSLILQPMMHDSLPYQYYPPGEEGETPTELVVWEKEPNYLLIYRHAPYGIPIYEGYYTDPKINPDGLTLHGEYIQAAINDLGIRYLGIQYRTIVHVEQEDAPIIPLEEIIARHSSAIKAQLMGPAARIELMYVPVAIPATPSTRVRLVPAWGFFPDGYGWHPFSLIDAITGLTIY